MRGSVLTPNQSYTILYAGSKACEQMLSLRGYLRFEHTQAYIFIPHQTDFMGEMLQ